MHSRKTILFAWELGGGLGHLMQMLPLAQDLARAGHRVFVAMRNIGGAASLYCEAGVHFLPAAFKTEGAAPFPRTLSFAHLLGNMGWSSDTGLFGLACAWRNLIKLVRADLTVFDHSPTALLASRGLPLRRALIGTGFFCPPDLQPLPALRSGGDQRQLLADERRVLGHANRVLRQWDVAPLERLGQLFAEVDENFLITFPELDHYGQRPDTRYWGAVNACGGIAPRWPEGSGRRIYAYLKRSADVAEILAELAQRGQPTLVYGPGMEPALRQRFESPRMRFETRPLDMSAVSRECDLAVLNANHGTLCGLLLEGKPVLMLPLHLEQRVLAERVSALGAGPWLTPRRGRGAELRRVLDEMLCDGRYAKGAGAFAARHGGFDARRQRREMLRRALGLLEWGGAVEASPPAEAAVRGAGVN